MPGLSAPATATEFLAGMQNLEMTLQYDNAPAGTYINIFSNWGDTSAVVRSTLYNYYSASPQVFYDNLGSLYYFTTGEVNSTNRNEYPDDGVKGAFYYILEPEKTTFLEYYRTNELRSVVLNPNRYYLPQRAEDLCDRSYEGMVVGDSTSTGEDLIPNGYWRDYAGLYLGESIPLAGITETVIPPSEILGVPQYDKQLNTSDTLKYGTVASASLTFTLNKPVEEAMAHNNDYLVLYYDFKNDEDYERLGFFYVDSIEAIDENTSRITAHDETYKLNKYVDDFLENYNSATTLNEFYRNLLDYCGCSYDTERPAINNGAFPLNNVYHAIKTTGVDVAHYIAILCPGFVHSNIDGDVVLQQYSPNNTILGTSEYTNLTYTAYDSDLLDKVRITSSNTLIGEDTGSGENIYFINDNPLVSSLETRQTLDNLANSILGKYEEIPNYRPAEIQFLILPSVNIGEIFSVITPKAQLYNAIAMEISIDASGVKIKSFGSQYYPVESESSSQFINLINDIDSVSGDVDNLESAQQILGQAITQNAEDIADLEDRVDTAESDISTLSTGLSTVSTDLQNKINNDNISQSNNLVSIKINRTTVSNITNQTYVDNAISNSEAKNSVAEANNLVSVKINNNEVNNIAKKGYVDGLLSVNTVFKIGTLNYHRSGSNYSEFVAYMGKSDMSAGIFVPLTYTGGGTNGSYFLWRVYNGTYGMLWDNGAGTYWINLTSGSFTEQ